MRLHDRFAAPVELAFVGDGQPGVFEGYGSVFGNVDHYDNVVSPGAFKTTLEKHAAAGTMPAMFAEHSAFMFGGDPLPIGVWQSMSEDSKGLHVKGKLSAMDTDHTKRIIGLMRDGAIKGLSIAFTVPEDGDVRSKKKGEPKRTINTLDLYSVDLVRDPANALAQVIHMNSVMRAADADTAAQAVAACLQLHRDAMSGQNSPTKAQRDEMYTHLTGAHKALTGDDLPLSLRSDRPTTIREFESWLRDVFQLSRSQAQAIAALGSFAPPRDEAGEAAAAEAAAKEARTTAIKENLSFLSSFSLSKKG